ncbi:MAG TPA: choice-of-anchor J domain-containing protein [Ignavibacteria bacterium]|nr:choice-of-anchor J domain-containing protein [Ignavibacteria bacterium]
MKKIYFVLFTFLSLGVFLGFTNSDNPKNGSKFFNGSEQDVKHSEQLSNDNNINPVSASGAPIYYFDNFDGANDTTSLKARDYLVYYRGSGPQGLTPTWFQGNSTVFPAYNGPDTGYIAANFNVVTNTNNIDSWLVLPDLTVFTGDVIRFQCRSVTSNPFPDSVRVMYNDQNGTTPESPGWVELGRFLATPSGNWEQKSFIAPTFGTNTRFAIRYTVVNGGPFGDNSNFIGIDELTVEGQGLLPVELSSFVSVVTNNNVTLNWSTASETNNSGFDIERSNATGEWSKAGSVTGNGTTELTSNYSFTDRNLNSGIYNYRLKQIDYNGNFEYFNLSNEVNVGVPSQFELSQNYPNPFNPSTSINFELPFDGKVSLKVFDMSGKEVSTLVNEVKAAGYYTYSFNASGLTSGIYFYTLNSNNFSSTKKMLLIK